MIKVVIWGASGHAKVVADILRLRGKHEIVGFLDSVDPKRKGDKFCGASVLGGEEQLNDLLQRGVQALIVGFGQCHARLRAAAAAQALGFRLINAIHPSVVLAAGTKIGAGNVFAAGAIVNPDCVIGENVILNTACSIDHDCTIGDGAHICPGARLGGMVRVGRLAWVGIGAVVKDHITIGEKSVVGAGSVVIRDISDGMVVCGIPARAIRRTYNDEP